VLGIIARKVHEQKLQEAVSSFTFIVTDGQPVARPYPEPHESRSHHHTLSVKSTLIWSSYMWLDIHWVICPSDLSNNFFYSCTVHLDVINVFYLPSNAQ